MPKTVRTPSIEFRLLADVQKRFDDLCRVKGQNRSQLAREAVAWYLDNQEKLTADARETVLQKQMKKGEDRMCSLLAKNAIDTATIVALLYENMGEKVRDERLTSAYNMAVYRTKKRLEGQGLAIKELMQEIVEADDKDSSKA